VPALRQHVAKSAGAIDAITGVTSKNMVIDAGSGLAARALFP
jgi:hypothetical protein